MLLKRWTVDMAGQQHAVLTHRAVDAVDPLDMAGQQHAVLTYRAIDAVDPLVMAGQQHTVLTYRAVDAVDPLDMAGHGINAGLLTPPHVFIEQMVRLQNVLH